MNDEELTILRRHQKSIHDLYGYWGGPSLAGESNLAADQDVLRGRSEAVLRLSQTVSDAARSLFDAQETLAELRTADLSGVWAGDAHNAAADVLTALHDDTTRAHSSFQEIAGKLQVYAERLAPLPRRDQDGHDALRRAASLANTQNTLDGYAPPNPLDYDDGVMQAAHRLAMEGVDARVAVHTEAFDNAQDYISAMHDIARGARAQQLDGFSPLDAIVLAGAGGSVAGQAPILSPAMDARLAAMLSTLDPGTRQRLFGLLGTARSPEQRAYLLRALAAGYSVEEVARFDAMIAGHGDDPAWLAQHLNPIDMDGSPVPGKQLNSFEGADWTQGTDPTCVAASTVTARAAVDPLYALQLTAGGHPDDPAFDNPQAFADRLKNEQDRVYDGDRHWYENFFKPGMTSDQSERVAEQEISVHTGVEYDSVEMGDRESRVNVLRQAERAVDDGYPVPFSTVEGNRAHQMMIIGHSGDQVQIYNPWGYTFWVSEDDFAAGNVNRVDTDIPRTPVSMRLPQEAHR